MSVKTDTYAILAENMIKKFKERGMDAAYYATGDEAVKAIMGEIPKGSTVTWGGSMTIEEMGLADAVRNSSDINFLDRGKATTPEEKRKLYSEQTLADYFLMSANAISMDGQLVNIDGNGNRVACLIIGPEHVYVIAGMNKVEPDLDSAIKRARNIASPENNVRLKKDHPCVKAGHCCDCLTPDCICNQIVITRRNSGGSTGRIKVILIGEELGY